MPRHSVPVPPTAALVSTEIHVIFVDTEVGNKVTVACAEHEVVESTVLHEVLVSDVPSECERWRETCTLALRELG